MLHNHEIFVVTTGVYDSYHIIALFTTRLLAADFIKRLKAARHFEADETIDIETFELNIVPEEYNVPPGFSYFGIEFSETGNVYEIRTEDITPDWGCIRTDQTSYMTVLAKDRKHAIKIASEHRTMMLAGNHKSWPLV